MVAETTTARPDNPFPRVAAAQWSAAAKATNRDRARAVLLPPRVELRPLATSGAISRSTGIDFIRTMGSAVSETISAAARGGGAGIAVAFSGSPHPLAGGVPVASAQKILEAATSSSLSEIRLSAGDSTVALADVVASAAGDAVAFTLDFDPIAAEALDGSARADTFARTVDVLDRHDRPGCAITADGRLWHAGGATDAQELGAVLATFVAYLRQLPRTDRISLALVADSDQFETIAKFRAMRLLALRVMQAARLGGPPPRLHAETAWRSLSAREPEMNILRGTAATFGAITGRADTITVLPFDALGTHGALGARLARNTHTILTEEAHLGMTADPGAGSGAIEARTDALCEAAWTIFRCIEEKGGIRAAISDGQLLNDIAAARDTRIAALREAQLKLVGVNAFAVSPSEPVAGVAALPTDRLAFHRLAEPFEAIP